MAKTSKKTIDTDATTSDPTHPDHPDYPTNKFVTEWINAQASSINKDKLAPVYERLQEDYDATYNDLNYSEKLDWLTNCSVNGLRLYVSTVLNEVNDKYETPLEKTKEMLTALVVLQKEVEKELSRLGNFPLEVHFVGAFSGVNVYDQLRSVMSNNNEEDDSFPTPASDTLN